jgi:hypothetical protein
MMESNVSFQIIEEILQFGVDKTTQWVIWKKKRRKSSQPGPCQ